MKNILLYILFLFAAVVFVSCEQPVEEEEIPYIPKLVVKGFIKEGKGVQDIYIGRTLPVSVKYNAQFANLTDAAAIIIHNDKLYPLKHTADGLYKNDTINIRKGEKYFLLASWQNLSASAETVVPIAGIFNAIDLKTGVEAGKDISYFEVTTTPFNNEVYGCTWVILLANGVPYIEADSFYTIASRTEAGVYKVRSTNIPKNYSTGNPPIGVRMYVYDKPFADFFNTQGSNKVSDAIFGQTGSSVKWNVKGDGIGMFLARRDTLIRFR